MPPQLLSLLLGGGLGMGGDSKGMGLANLAGGLLGGITGLFQRNKANKLIKNLVYPEYTIPSDINENKTLATKMAGQGLPSEQYNQAMQNIQRQQVAAIRNAQDRRSGLGLIGAIQDNTNRATLGLDVADANARIANQRALMNVNSQVAGYKDKAFQWNKANKYQMDRDYAYSLLGSGNQNLIGGIDKGAAGLGLLYGSGAFNGLFGKRNNAAPTDEGNGITFEDYRRRNN